MEYEYSQLVPELKYLLKDVVRIVDQKQQKLYVKHNLYPVDMYVTTDERTKELPV